MFQTLFQKFAEGQRNLAFEAEELETEKDKSAGQVRLILLPCLLAVKCLLHPVTQLKNVSEYLAVIIRFFTQIIPLSILRINRGCHMFKWLKV